MMLYSIEPKDWVFVKVYGLLPFAKNMCKNIGKSITKNVSDKYSQKCLDFTKQSVTDTLNCFQKSNLKNSRSN